MHHRQFALSASTVVVTSLLAFTACGENLLGPLNDRTFVLRTIDGQPLPATIPHEFGGLAWIVEADTIWLEGGDQWRRRALLRREPGVGGDPWDPETEGHITIHQGVFVLDFDCDDNASCIAPDRFVGTSAWLEMERTWMHSGRRLVFEPL